MSAEYKNASIDILKDICKERKNNFVRYDLILTWLEKHKVKTYGELEELLDSNDSEKLNGISRREKKQLRYEISQQKLKTSQPQKKFLYMLFDIPIVCMAVTYSVLILK